MTFISYAQNFEDVLLWRALKGVREGFYIDVGAQHPDVNSVTRAFYDRGWSGINVEPVPGNAQRLRDARLRDTTLELALGAERGEASFFVVEGTGLSTLERAGLARLQQQGFAAAETSVEVETLAEVCRRHVRGPIHFLKIDVEGSEAAVLAGADLAAFRPWIVLVEATAPLSSEPTHGDWEGILLRADYRFAWFDGLNRFYVAGEHAASLLPAFAIPPNVADDFLRAADVEWARRLHGAEGQAEALGRRMSETERARRASEQAAERAHLLLATESAQRAGAEQRAEQAERRADGEHHRAESEAREAERARREAAELRQNLETEHAEAETAKAWLAAMRSSRSWRITAPLRQVRSATARLPAAEPPLPPSVPDPAPPTQPLAEPPRPVPAGLAPPLRTGPPVPFRLRHRRRRHPIHAADPAAAARHGLPERHLRPASRSRAGGRASVAGGAAAPRRLRADRPPFDGS